MGSAEATFNRLWVLKYFIPIGHEHAGYKESALFSFNGDLDWEGERPITEEPPSPFSGHLKKGIAFFRTHSSSDASDDQHEEEKELESKPSFSSKDSINSSEAPEPSNIQEEQIRLDSKDSQESKGSDENEGERVLFSFVSVSLFYL